MIAAIAVVTSIMVISLLVLVRLADGIEEENRMIESGIESARMYNEALEERTKTVRRLRHDAMGLLQAIEGIRSGLDRTKLPGDAVMPCRHVFGMPLLDAVISLKQDQCDAAGIRFEIAVSGFTDASHVQAADEADLCLLIQNLLENAYEANLRIEDPHERYLSLTASADRGKILVSVANRIDSGEKLSFITRKSNPELHGIGMKVIDEIQTKYNGSRAIKKDRESSVIEISVTLYPLPE